MRAFGGAILFAFPLVMTMEMWWLGFYMDRLRLLLFLALNLVLLLGLSYYAGFRTAFDLKEDALDAFAAAGVGVLAAAAMLAAFGLIGPGMGWDELLGKVAVQSVPASVGAMAARRQLGDDDGGEAPPSYQGQLVLMLAGALFLAFNVAPTEEMVLIALQMEPWQGMLLVGLSVAVLHAFVYSLDFSGQERLPGDGGFRRSFFGFSVAGYGIAVLVSLYVLWTFGRTDGTEPGLVAMMTVVLGFPAALGAALARLVV
ncbi:TIGR02587 family membrane protein [Rubellimicrobium roseum]|uniref:TIGR02587 family membrane protein n=2 Tax=Rubellimicrobium roseum TaxID=687525 RepID=A0A5C4NCQ3_9RHOB|nr:TIGR02587 family membrane protein [Rubellimicrobium roseum]